MKYNDVIVGQQIKKEREKIGMSQGKLALYLNIGRNRIIDIEKGRGTFKYLNLDKVILLCDLFHCELGYLLGEEEYKNKTKIKTTVSRYLGLSSDAIDRIRRIRRTDEKQISILSRIIESKKFIDFLNSISTYDYYYSEQNHQIDIIMHSYIKFIINDPDDKLTNYLLEEMKKEGEISQNEIDELTPEDYKEFKLLLQNEAEKDIKRHKKSIKDSINRQKDFMISYVKHNILDNLSLLIGDMFP